MRDVLLIDADVDGRGRPVDVRVRGGFVVDVGAGLDRAGAEIVDGGGAALLPGLHDHHLHIHSLAAALRSVPCGPPDVRTEAAFASALHAAAVAAPPGAWIRGVGYHESVAGLLDRRQLDAIVRDHPVRIQHRSGVLWMLNTAALDAIGAAERSAGLELDDGGAPTGRLFHEDRWLAERIGGGAGSVDLAPVGALY